MIDNNYLEKVYSGFLGMNIGIRLGAPVEPTIWTYKRIKDTYGDITGYIKDYKNFAADDDVNGPVYFLRALYDDAGDRELEPQDVARAWLNYAREGAGMFWWGGYGRSTEHTAYINMKMGIPAPQSGSIRQNGKTIAEQIGGQIFIDTWGLVWPGDFAKAAEYAAAAASVSHDGEGLNGARFIAACISKAFDTADINEIIKTGLTVIPEKSTYRKVVESVLQYHLENPEDFRKCRDYLEENWGYDKYPGVCHIIPNAGVCALALIYGKGDFNRTIEIATMCGWDTDCNAGNVGTILGVAVGLSGIKEHYRKPVNDGIVLSGISGYLNILDIPTYAKELALLGYRLAGAEAPRQLLEAFKPGEIYFDFELPGSTHNFRVSEPFYCSLRHSEEVAYKGTGSLEVVFDRMERGKECRIYYKPFYRRSDFDDERYSPTFAPTVYPGQKVNMKIYLDHWNGAAVYAEPYARNSYNKKDITNGLVKLADKKWIEVEYTVPDMEGATVDEIGIILTSMSPSNTKDLGRIFIDEFSINGKAHYTVDFAKQNHEFGCITPFANNHGAWTIENGYMSVISAEPCEAYTGNYYSRDVRVSASVIPQHGESHLLAFRAQGAMRGYHVGFDGENKVSLIINNFGISRLITVPFCWEYEREYVFKAIAQGSRLSFSIDGKKLLDCEDSTFEYGMIGFSKYAMGRTLFGKVEVEEL